MEEPTLDGLGIAEYSATMFNNVASFIENISVYSFQTVLETSIGIAEIPADERKPIFPKRFTLWIPGRDFCEWSLAYSEEKFR